MHMIHLGFFLHDGYVSYRNKTVHVSKHTSRKSSTGSFGFPRINSSNMQFRKQLYQNFGDKLAVREYILYIIDTSLGCY